MTKLAMDLTTITAKVRRYAQGARIRSDLVILPQVIECIEDQLSRSWAIIFSANIPTVTIADTSFEWPATWWEHVKQRWSPQWVLKRWPVKLSHGRLSVDAVINHPVHNLNNVSYVVSRNGGPLPLACERARLELAVLEHGGMDAVNAYVSFMHREREDAR